MTRIAQVCALSGLLSLVLCLAPDTRAQPKDFEVLSFKYTGSFDSHTTREMRDGREVNVVHWKPPELIGTRFYADAQLPIIIQFAFLPLVHPYRQETPDWMRFEYYTVDARAQAGTNLDGAREMLRTALAKRLNLQYHLADRMTPVYHLVRGSGALRLTPSTEPDPKAGSRQSMWVFRYKAADLASLASFLSSVAGVDVIDKTGIQGKYRFDIDWSQRLQEGDMRTEGTHVADDALRPLGLKLLAAKEMRKILVVDRANKIPTLN